MVAAAAVITIMDTLLIISSAANLPTVLTINLLLVQLDEVVFALFLVFHDL
jgi:hypothetical protein